MAREAIKAAIALQFTPTSSVEALRRVAASMHEVREFAARAGLVPSEDPAVIASFACRKIAPDAIALQSLHEIFLKVSAMAKAKANTG